jgi:hypothetical protein
MYVFVANMKGSHKRRAVMQSDVVIVDTSIVTEPLRIILNAGEEGLIFMVPLHTTITHRKRLKRNESL